MLINKKTKQLLQDIIAQAESLGLSISDIYSAKDLLQHHEFGLCFKAIITQLYEYNIGINNEFYLKLEKAANMMKLPESSFSFMKELIKG